MIYMNKKIVIISFVIFLSLTSIIFAQDMIAKVFLYPSSAKKTVGSALSVSINVANVSNLYGYDFKLYYDTRILDVKNVTEGSFLKSKGLTFFKVKEMKDNYNSTHGRVWMYSTMLSPAAPASGFGTVAIIEFKSVKAGTVAINLYDTKFVNSNSGRINISTLGGYYEFTTLTKSPSAV